MNFLTQNAYLSKWQKMSNDELNIEEDALVLYIQRFKGNTEKIKELTDVKTLLDTYKQSIGMDE